MREVLDELCLAESHPQVAPIVVAAPRRAKFRVLAPLVLLLILWLWLFYSEGAYRGGPSGNAFGADFAMFMGGAQVLKQGGNLYNPAVLYRTERRMMRQQHLSMTPKKSVVRVGNPPLFFWLLEPLLLLPFQAVALIWILAMLAISAIGFLTILRFLGWTAWRTPFLVFMMMPQVILGGFYGNVIGIVFAAIGLSLALVRKYPYLAGILLIAAWLKPPVALPIVMLIVLFHAPARVKVLSAWLAATAGLVAFTGLVTGWHSLSLWIGGLFRYSKDMAIQPDVASLAGLYVRWAPSGLRTSLGALSLAVAVVLTGYAWWRLRGSAATTILAVAWLWFVWMLATPYAHFFDEMLLAVPVLALLGRNGVHLSRRSPAVALYLMFFSLLFISWTPLRMYLLPLPLLAVCVLLAKQRVRSAGVRPKLITLAGPSV